MTTSARWEEKFHEQVNANNLLSDKLRKYRKSVVEMIHTMQDAHVEQVNEIKDLKHAIQLMEAALLKEISGYDADGKPK